MIGVVVSRADSASRHVGEHLRAVADWTVETDGERPDADGGGTVYRTDGFELREFEEWHLHLEGVAAAFDDPDLLLFASRHSGETGPLLTAHHTGNFGPAEFGGADRELARAAPNAHRHLLRAFERFAPDGYEVGTECTHHGPSAVGAPSLFVELGSGETEWDDPEGARAVARSILALRGVAPDAPAEDGRRRHLVGFGGGHYAPRFERVIRETGWAVGHVAADWCLEAMGRPASHPDLLRAAFEQSEAEYALVEGDRPDLVAEIEALGYRAVSETWVREVDGVSLGLAAALEDAVGTVDDGLRFGDRAPGADAGTEFAVVGLPLELLAEARGIDAEATRDAVAAATLAFGTDENGTRVVGPAAVESPANRRAVVDGLVDVLGRKYDAVERTDGRVVARETAFDPERARTLGVPEGPKFGRLADGDPVEVDGEIIEPDTVSRKRTREFEVTFNP
ncbi:hypothetical protein BRC83_05580 [Halobacteriales archaeon QS_1_68_17]|nr:MAG: hypothetical protein BRC83_05580 [Halobacteriales archaeon QS_1_68_17]